MLFSVVMRAFQATPLAAAVVLPVIFDIFFLALLALLALSNAILIYGSLFRGPELPFLLTSPIAPRNIVWTKYFESLFLASWSLILLGIPLMLAMADCHEEPWLFYPLFVAFFLAFVPIPAALGLVLAWGAGRFGRRLGRKLLTALTAMIVLIAVIWLIKQVHRTELISEKWATGLFDRMQFAQAALLPSAWVSRGLEHSLQQEYGLAAGYLAVTVANSLFFSWLVVTWCGRRFLVTFDRISSDLGGVRPAAASSARPRLRHRLYELAFFYLPGPMRLIAGKDLRTFFRDPLQWSQLAILFGLLTLYLLNLPPFFKQLSESSWAGLAPFLNLCAVSLMLATFTSRFVFPLISLEGQQLWLIGLLPLPRRSLVKAKFAYALSITATVATLVTLLAAHQLRLSWWWTSIQLALTWAVCIGLCGLAVGLGARMPAFRETNSGRIANGYGGTLNLLASIALIVVVLTASAVAMARSQLTAVGVLPEQPALALLALAVILAVVTGVVALHVGARHLDRLEA